ncbi:PREDICTED: RIB43A-like with coiled-coils protein 2 [Condylura cristata]|uniref:RIB43A-like with coiled-coils protein 2 n=1 Tax=Condylura cristata TaxID=143302 RepID=UPI0006439660|nr:PREDICTED: RIB43A-like with coiled-coils protein 2 [Condylura cristata]
MAVAQPEDLQQDFNQAKRRHAELCRQKRIFNARNRIIGGDTAAWDAQVRDQKIRDATERARHEAFAAEMRQNDKTMSVLEARARSDRRARCRAVQAFQQAFQRPETRREFDLSDPLALKKDLPARQSDNDVRNTVSGMQKFMGEDLNFPERKRLQEEQNREWSLQQQREREAARAGQQRAGTTRPRADPSFPRQAAPLGSGFAPSPSWALTCPSGERDAAESAERRIQEKKQEQEDNMAELANLLHGDLLSENPQQAASARGPQRVVPDRWKGMSQEQLDQIRLAQKQQVQEKLLRLGSECPEGSGRFSRGRYRLLLLFVLRKLSMKEAFTNYHTEDYFSQFNTGSR